MATLRLVPASGSPVEVKGDSALVGREPGCDVVVSDGSVSRKHARLERRGSGWAVVDQGSANGTFLDSQRVAEAAIQSGQEIRFGQVAFRAEFESDDDLAATMMATPSPAVTVVASAEMTSTPALGAPRFPARAPARPPVSAPPPLPKAGPPPLARPPATAKQVPGAAGSLPPHVPANAPPRPRVGAPPLAPVGQIMAPPVSGKKGKGPIFWVLTGCCGCLLLGVMLAAGIFGTFFLSTQAPATAVQTQLVELRRGDLEAAYNRLSSELQAQLPRDEFERLVQEHPGLKDNKDATFWSRSINNDKAKLSGILTSQSGERETATFELVKEGGDWRVSAIRVGDAASE